MKEWYPASRVSGPLAGLAEGFADWLREQEFSAQAVSHRMWQFDRLSGWLERQGLAPAGLTEARAQQFVADRASGVAHRNSGQTLRLPLAYLREVGAVPTPRAEVTPGPVDVLLDRFGEHLARERGLAAKSVREYRRVVRPFLAVRQRSDSVAVEQLTAGDVTSFLARECPRRSVSEARQLTKAMRALLRYLHTAVERCFRS